MINQFLCSCDCEVAGRAIPDAQSCEHYPLLLSQACGLLILPAATPPPSDWTSPAAWNEILDNTVAGAGAAKYIAGEGSLYTDSVIVNTYAKRARVIALRRYAVEIALPDLDNLYETARRFQKERIAFRFWVQTLSGRLYGGDNGIAPAMNDAAFPLSAGRDDKGRAIIRILFDATCDPDFQSVEFAAEDLTPWLTDDPLAWQTDGDLEWLTNN